jgi:hypothetical protein
VEISDEEPEAEEPKVAAAENPLLA